jgi:hypothetical protein
MLLTGLIERRLRLRDRLLPPLALSLLGRFFPPTFGFAPPLFALEILCGLSGGGLGDHQDRLLLRSRADVTRSAVMPVEMTSASIPIADRSVTRDLMAVLYRS